MKSSIPFLPALLALALAAPLTAQTTPAAVIKTVEPVRLAYVNSSAFLDEQAGIKQLVKVAQGLELEFSGTQSELSLLNEKLRTIVGELTKLNADPVANAKAMAEQQAAGQNYSRNCKVNNKPLKRLIINASKNYKLRLPPRSARRSVLSPRSATSTSCLIWLNWVKRC